MGTGLLESGVRPARAIVPSAPLQLRQRLVGSDQTKCLTGARAVAAGWVLFFHMSLFAGPLFERGSSWVTPAMQGYLGVDFFFMLSGFILAHQFLKRMSRPSFRSATRFWLHRLARIYPMHLVTMLMVAVMVLAAMKLGKAPTTPDKLSPKLALANLLLVHAWGGVDRAGWNEPSWSISCEWFVYLAFPAVAAILARIKSRFASWFVCLAPLAGLLVTEQLLLGAHDIHHIPLRFSLIRVTFEFLAGCGAFLVYRCVNARSVPVWGATAVVVAIVVAVAVRRADPWILPLFPLLILVLAARPDGRIAMWLARPGAVRFGEISFSVYLVHQHVIYGLGRVLPFERVSHSPWPVRALVGAFVLGVVVAMSSLAYRWIEQPARQWLRRRVDRHVREESGRSPAERSGVAGLVRAEVEGSG